MEDTGKMNVADRDRIVGLRQFSDHIFSGKDQSEVLTAMRQSAFGENFCRAWFDGHSKMTAESPVVQSLESENSVKIFGPIVSQGEADFMRMFYGSTDYVTPKQFLEDLGKIDGDVTLLVNCPGGEVSSAAVMRQAIQQRVNDGDQVKLNVVGMAASAASFVALDAQESVISDCGTFMIHQARLTIAKWENMRVGDIRSYAEELQGLLEWLEQVDDVMVDIYQKRSGIEKDEIVEMMRKETYLTGAKAVERGFIDSVYSVESEKKDKEMESKHGKDLNSRLQAMQEAYRKVFDPYGFQF